MKNMFKGLGIGLFALMLVVGMGAGSANAALTLGALNIASDGALTLTGAVASNADFASTTTTGNLTLGGALTTGSLTIGNFSGTTENVVIYGGASSTNNNLFTNVTTGQINIGAVNTGGINIGYGFSNQAITIGSTNGTSSLALKAGSGGVNVTGTLSATAPKITTSINDVNGNVILGLSPGASAVNYLQLSNSPANTNLAINTIGSDTNISLSFNTKGAGVFNFQNQTALDDTIVIAPHVGGAAFFAGTLTSADLTASRTWTFPDATTTVAGLAVAQTFSANQTMGAGVKLVLDSGTATAIAGAATLSKQAGIVTSEALTTAAAGTYTLTLTNTLITVSSNILAQATLGTSTTGTPLVTKITPGAGSATIVVTNIAAAAALNGTLLINFTILN